jgi:hypothetical protein
VKRRNIFHTTRVRRSGTEVDGTGGFENIGPIIRVDSPFFHKTKQPTGLADKISIIRLTAHPGERYFALVTPNLRLRVELASAYTKADQTPNG